MLYRPTVVELELYHNQRLYQIRTIEVNSNQTRASIMTAVRSAAWYAAQLDHIVVCPSHLHYTSYPNLAHVVALVCVLTT